MESIPTILNNYNFGKWVDYIDHFMSRYRLWPRGDSAWVAVSAGRDSTLLLWSMYALFQRGRFKNLKMLHFNHGTRPECAEGEEEVVGYSRLLQLPLEKGYPLVGLGKSNIEHSAREERYNFFKGVIDSRDRVYLGHHLDDSLEWSLMARFKSGRLASQLGIPLINGAFARPFLCVTRGQITRMAKKIGLDWREDDSNRNIRFERNFLRSHVIPPIKRRFPAYLRHYATSSNQLARKLGIWRGGREPLFEQRALPLGGVGLFNFTSEKDFGGAEEIIRGIVEKLSSRGRGCLTAQVEKMIEAAAKGRQGPIFFSGSVRGYMAPGVLFFIHSDKLYGWEHYDRAIVKVLEKETSLENIPFPRMGRGELVGHIGRMPFPHLGVGPGGGGRNTGGRHFLLPRASALFRERGWRLNPLVKMALGMKKEDKKSLVLPLDLLAQMGDFYCSGSEPKVKMKGRL